MIVYDSTKEGFLNDASKIGIEDIVAQKVLEKLGHKVGPSEYSAWANSLGKAMYHVLNTPNIPNDAGVAIEYSIPRTRNRVDFIISGENESGQEQVVIVELKQWSEVELTEKDAMIKTYVGGGNREELHPSYQSWTYTTLLNGFNQTVYDENIKLIPCAYLHNLKDKTVICDRFYEDYIDKSPVFIKSEQQDLQNFISKHLKYGDKKRTMYRIDNGRIKPSKELSENLISMMKGNPEFIMIDDQKIVYENALALARRSSAENKNVMIIEGGPGTGKTVLAINLLVSTTKSGQVSQYVTKNAAPRAVFESKLTGTFKKSEISNFFTGSGSFIDTKENLFDVLIVDEAHRLNGKSGMFKNLGDNQIKEIISASKSSVFFIDEDQRVTWNDIGESIEIERLAKEQGATVTRMKLESQFRCNGSDGYLSWLDNALQIKETANKTLDGINYDFKIVDSPIELRDLIVEKNKENNRARMVAGYCWDWESKKNKNINDIIFPQFNFEAKWNLDTDGSLWIISPNSVNEIGCIHTCQGLEVDYIGVIIGPDMIFKDEQIVTDGSKRSKNDSSMKGYKAMLKTNPEEAKRKADLIIKNTYRTLMTRGLKGCYVYCTDSLLKEKLRSLLTT